MIKRFSQNHSPVPPVKGITSRPALQERLNSSDRRKVIYNRHLDLREEKTNIGKGLNKVVIKS